MKITLIVSALACAALAWGQEGPESTPSGTQAIALTAWTSATTCGLGPFASPSVATASPACQVSTGGILKFASLRFPANVKTCVHVTLMQPNEIDEADINTTRPLTIRGTYTREGGGTGASGGGICTGQCAALTARVFSHVDGGTFINAPAYGPEFPSDLLPNGGGAFPGKKITWAIRGITFPVNKRNPLVVEICRNPTTDPRDTSTGILKLVNPLTVVWPTVGLPQPEALEAPAGESAVPIE